MSNFTKEIKFIPNYCETIDIKFFLKGEKGIIQFCITTNWTHRMIEFDEKIKSYAYDIGYHSPVPLYEGQKPMEKCSFYKTCYYDGSSMYARKLFGKLINYGDEYIWNKMEEFYDTHFNKKENE